MEREAIIEYLEKVIDKADDEYAKNPINKRYTIWYWVRSILNKNKKYSDEELLQIAMDYEDILPLDLDD